MGIDKYLEGEVGFSKLKVPKRLAVTLIIVLVSKAVGNLLLYYLMDIQSSGTYWMNVNRSPAWEQNRVFTENVGQTANWLYLFVGWDSAWYLSIMTRGYSFSNQSYAFAPALPAFGKVFSFFLGNPIASIVACSTFFGVLWVPMYQLVAENYMDRGAALGSTLLFAFFPYVFLFTTVAYSEGLFLFFTLGAWYFFKKRKVLYAAAFASAATVTRPIGLLMVLPMLLWSLKEKGSLRFRHVFLSILPIGSLFLWLSYCKLTANDWLAPVHTTEWNAMYPFRVFFLEVLPKSGIQAFYSEIPYEHWLSPFSIWGAILVVPFLIWMVAKKDKPLATYSLVYYLGILAGGALLSVPRFLSVLYPVWIPPTATLFRTKRSIACVITISMLFYAGGLTLWAGFLDGKLIA